MWMYRMREVVKRKAVLMNSETLSLFLSVFYFGSWLKLSVMQSTTCNLPLQKTLQYYLVGNSHSTIWGVLSLLHLSQHHYLFACCFAEENATNNMVVGIAQKTKEEKEVRLWAVKGWDRAWVSQRGEGEYNRQTQHSVFLRTWREQVVLWFQLSALEAASHKCSSNRPVSGYLSICLQGRAPQQDI